MAGRGNVPLRPGGPVAPGCNDAAISAARGGIHDARPARGPGRDAARSWTSDRGRADGQQRNRKVKFMRRLPAFNFSGITVGRDIMEQSGMTRALGDG